VADARAARLVFDHLAKIALDPAESVTMLKRIEAEI
jgi:hypothetical protein